MEAKHDFSITLISWLQVSFYITLTHKLPLKKTHRKCTCSFSWWRCVTLTYLTQILLRQGLVSILGDIEGRKNSDSQRCSLGICRCTYKCEYAGVCSAPHDIRKKKRAHTYKLPCEQHVDEAGILTQTSLEGMNRSSRQEKGCHVDVLWRVHHDGRQANALQSTTSKQIPDVL